MITFYPVSGQESDIFAQQNESDTELLAIEEASRIAVSHAISSVDNILTDAEKNLSADVTRARELLNQANESLNKGLYGKALEYATNATRIAIKSAIVSVNENITNAEKPWVNVSEARKKLGEAEKALENENYSVALDYVKEANANIKEPSLLPEILVLGILVLCVLAIAYKGRNIFSEAWNKILLRRKKKRSYLETIDNIFETYKANLQKCKAELNKLKESLVEDFKLGKIKEDDYSLAEKKINDYLTNISKAMAKDIRDIFPPDYTVLLIGPPGVGKFEYCVNLTKRYLKKDEKVVYVTTKESPSDIRDRIKKLEDMDLRAYEGGRFLFIDTTGSSRSKNDEKVLYAESMTIGARLLDATETLGTPVRIISNSLSNLLHNKSDKEIIKFFEDINTKIKRNYGFALYTLQEGAHDEKVVTVLKSMVDAVLEMKMDEPSLKRTFRIAYAKDIIYPPDWFEYKVAEHGFEMVRE